MFKKNKKFRKLDFKWECIRKHELIKFFEVNQNNYVVLFLKNRPNSTLISTTKSS